MKCWVLIVYLALKGVLVVRPFSERSRPTFGKQANLGVLLGSRNVDFPLKDPNYFFTDVVRYVRELGLSGVRNPYFRRVTTSTLLVPPRIESGVGHGQTRLFLRTNLSDSIVKYL